MIAKFALTMLIAIGCSSAAIAQTTASERDRKAAAALALASSPEPTIVVAPMPRFKPLGYEEAYQQALDRGEVFVAYIGCAGRHPIDHIPGAAVCSVLKCSGCESGTILIGYPTGGSIWEFRRLKCEEWPSVVAAVEAVRPLCKTPAKSEVKVSPRLPWDI